MSSEKIIKNQAKTSLKGNWLTLIASLLFAFTVALAITQLYSLLLVAFDIIDINTEEIKSGGFPLLFAISVGVIIFSFFLTPIINGVIKMFCDISKGKKAEIKDIFYYFKGSKRYFKTLYINLLLFLSFYAFSNIFDLYLYFKLFTGRALNDGHSFDFLSLSLILAFIFSVIIKILVYLVFIHYPLIAYSYNESISNKNNAFADTFGLLKFSFVNLSTTINLFLSFTGWLLLCFFVVPAFYVLPYLLTACTTSAKWLLLSYGYKEALC